MLLCGVFPFFSMDLVRLGERRKILAFLGDFFVFITPPKKGKGGPRKSSPFQNLYNLLSETKRGILWAWGFPAERTKECQAPIKLAISGPRIVGGKITGTRLFPILTTGEHFFGCTPMGSYGNTALRMVLRRFWEGLLASGTLPLYSGPCLGVKGGCVSQRTPPY